MMPRYLLTLLLPAILNAPLDTPSQMSSAPTPEQRRDAFDDVSKRFPLSDPAMQAGVVRLFERESNDPRWEEFDEAEWYEDYCEKVSDACQKVAVEFNNTAAWHALVYSNYNEGSPFGMWLASQPQAFPLFWQLAYDRNAAPANTGIVMAAEALLHCQNSKAKECAPVLAMSGEVSAFMRTRLAEGTSSLDNFKGGALLAYKIRGTKKDIPFLEQQIQRFSRENYTDKDREVGRNAAIALLKQAINQISSR